MTERRRSFDDFRPKPSEPNPKAEILKAAVAKIAATPEGKVLFAYMQEVSDYAFGPDASDGALRDHNGVRRFIANLKAMIADVGQGTVAG